MEHTVLQEVIDSRVNECFGCPNDLISASVLHHESHSWKGTTDSEVLNLDDDTSDTERTPRRMSAVRA
jgi:hypothetical protein